MKNKYTYMKNKIHQFLWKILKNFLSKPKPLLSPLEDLAPMMQKKIDFANYFGGAKVVFLGDSNGENISSDDLSMFKPVSINLSKGGTRADGWLKFFKTPAGILIYNQIKNKEVIINIGGNHILQGAMDVWESSFDELFAMFPNAWYITVPQIHSNLLEQFGHEKSAKQINSELHVINDKIKSKTNKVINIYPLTTLDGETPIFFVHEDVVHFSKKYDQKIRIPFIKQIVGI